MNVVERNGSFFAIHQVEGFFVASNNSTFFYPRKDSSEFNQTEKPEKDSFSFLELDQNTGVVQTHIVYDRNVDKTGKVRPKVKITEAGKNGVLQKGEKIGHDTIVFEEELPQVLFTKTYINSIRRLRTP